LTILLAVALLCCGNPSGGREDPAGDARPGPRVEDAASRPTPAPPDAGPLPRPEEGVTVVVRVDHRGAGARRVSEQDAAVRLVVEQAGGRTRIGTAGAALPIRSNAYWHLPAPSGAWLEVVEGAPVDEEVVVRPAGGNAFDVAVDGGGSARIAASISGPDDPILRGALAPLVAASVGQADLAAVTSALATRTGAIRGWEVRWPGRPAVAWTVEASRRETMLLPQPEGDEVPAPLRLQAGAAEAAAELAARFSGAPSIDERSSLTVRNSGARTMLFYVRGRLVGWIGPGGAGRFLGLPAGHHPAFATTLRGTVTMAASVTVPGDWTIEPGPAQASSPSAAR